MIALQIAFKNLLAARARTLFLGAALFLVTMLMVLLMSLTAGISDNMIRTTTTISSGHVNIGGFYKTSPSDVAPMITKVDELKAAARAALPDAVRITDRQRGWGKIISDAGTVQAGINGIEPDDEAALFHILSPAKAGEYMENPPDPEKRAGDFRSLKDGGIILFASQAKQLKVDVGDAVTLRTETMRGQSNTADATVVAIAHDLGPMASWATFVTKRTVQNLYQLRPEVSGAVQIYFDDVEKSEDGMNRLRDSMAKHGWELLDHESAPFFMKFQTVMSEDWTGQRYDITTWKDEASFLQWILTAISSISFLLLSMLTLIIVIGIMNTMYIAVRERTREIGTLRAIGMSRGGVLRLFILEAFVLGLVATLAGALTGAVVAGAIDAANVRVDVDAVRAILLSDAIHLVTRPGHVIGAVIAFTFISAFAALWPSLRAAKIQPVTAMQSAD
jgi:putative ABC transport system permease protein